MEDFQTKKKTRVAILSMKAAGVGLNLTRASTVIFAELTWTPGIISQCEDRAHRIGQQNSVNVIFLVARNTVDDILWPMINSKVSTLGKMLDARKDKFKARVIKQDKKKKKKDDNFEEEIESEEESSLKSYPRGDLRSMLSPSLRVKKKKKKTSSTWTCSVCTFFFFLNQNSFTSRKQIHSKLEKQVRSHPTLRTIHHVRCAVMQDDCLLALVGHVQLAHM